MSDFYLVDALVKALYDGEVQMPFTITLSNGSSVTLMTSDTVYDHLSVLFGKYRYYPPTFITGQIPALFKSTFTNFIARNNHNIARQYEALAADYNPIYNYDLTEQGADGSRVAKTTTTATPSGTVSVSSAHTGTDTTTDSRYGFDSAAAAPADKSELSHGETVTDTTSFTNYKTETTAESSNDQSVTLPDGGSASGFDRGSEHYMHRYGNIGVQTAADIIGGELELRVHDIAVEWLRRFSAEYLVYVG